MAEEEEEEEELCESEVVVVVRRRKQSLLTSLVLSMAFRMATLSFSRADRTLTYSPRCGVKYSRRRNEGGHSAIHHNRDNDIKIYCKNL